TKLFCHAIVEPITGGNITGPMINGIIIGGTAIPTLYNNQTTEVASVMIYGNTTDGYPYIGRGEGLGLTTGQVAQFRGVVHTLWKPAGLWSLRSRSSLVEAVPNPYEKGTHYKSLLRSNHYN
ncbi:MAG: hypothetical protein LQ340_007200, partial [Diploschistes diacapsis]